MFSQEKTIYVSDLRKPATWRWDRARTLSEQKRKVGIKTVDDDLTCEATRYLYKKRGGSEAADLAKEFPYIYEADVIYMESSVDRWTLEALTIARESQEKIAAYTGAPVELVDTFEKLFFDVRSRLNNPGFVNMRILGNNMREVGFNDPDGMWKIIGYSGGPQMLYAMWSCKLPAPNIIDWYKGMRKWELLQASARVAKSRIANAFNSAEIVDAAFKVDEMEMAAAQNKPADNTTNNLLTQLNYTIANIVPEANKDNKKRELRAEEKVQAQLEAAGITSLDFIDVTPDKEVTVEKE